MDQIKKAKSLNGYRVFHPDILGTPSMVGPNSYLINGTYY